MLSVVESGHNALFNIKSTLNKQAVSVVTMAQEVDGGRPRTGSWKLLRFVF